MNLPDGLYAPPLAHRGLWRQGGTPENSLSAFEKACQTHYGVELDVQMSADGEAMVFHDATLERMTGIKASIWDLHSSDLQALPLLGGPDCIPTLQSVLSLVAGRVMLLVEIKASADGGGALEARVAQLLDQYRGPAAVISFDPDALAWFALGQPDRPRGLDAAGLSDDDLAKDDGGLLETFEQSCALAQPHFMVLQAETAMGQVGRGQRAQGRPVVAWTVRSADEAARVADHCDNFIFEGFTA